MTAPGPDAGLPLVSIGVPTYNRARRLERALRSALDQDYPNLEVVISDNASDDDTADLCARFAASDARVRYLRQPVNRGVHANFKTVLAESRGTLYMWLGDDDWLDPGYVSACAALLRADPTYALVSGFDRYYVQGRMERDGPRVSLEQDSPSERVVGYFRQVAMNGVFYGVMRRDLIAAIPFPDMFGGDWMIVGAMAFLGKIRTLSTVGINRSFEGVSSDIGALAAKFGLSKFKRENPHLTIATSVFADIAWRSPAYRPLSAPGRATLAARAFDAIVRRHYSLGTVVKMARQLLEPRAR